MDASEADALVNVRARIDVWVGNFTDTLCMECMPLLFLLSMISLTKTIDDLYS
jgi:hypothetical protein